MGCHAIGLGGCCPNEPILCFSRSSIKSNLNIYNVPCNVASNPAGAGFHKFPRVYQASINKHSSLQCRTYAIPVGLEEQSPSGSSEFQDDEPGSADPEEELPARPPSSDELKSLLADTQRSKLARKLSEANQHNRFLKRQLQGREDALVNYKSELAILEQEVKALVALADEIAKAGIPEGSRKINGKYIHSHLVSRLEADLICWVYGFGISVVVPLNIRKAVQQKLENHTKDVAAAQAKEVPVFWIGMAESVQVMGSFDGWSQGEHLSPEYTGSYTKFSATLFLRPGRYEIKFLVDGEWRISPEFPTVGEGMMGNNLLVVE